MSNARALALALALMAVSCRGTKGSGDPNESVSPQASQEPAPVANVIASGAVTATSDAGTPAVPMRSDVALNVDTIPREPREMARDLREAKEALLRETRDAGADGAPAATNAGKIPRDPTRESRELAGYTLNAVLRVSDAPAPYKAPEVVSAALDTARKKTEPRLVVDLSQTRARVLLASSGFVLPPETELRSRVDRYGHLVIVPKERAYRVVAPGSMRAVLAERRLDVAPISIADVTSSGEGPKRLSYATRRVEVVNRVAKATFELATLKEAGDGGALVCRLLLDLMAAPPSTPVCAPDEVPLHVEFAWTTKGVFAFDVVALTRRTDLGVADLAAPPLLAFTSSPFPAQPAESLLTRAEFAALRTGPVDVPTDAREKKDAEAPPLEGGLVVSNASDVLRFVWLDGAPVAWVLPRRREHLQGLHKGRYSVAWRTFLGDTFDSAQTINVPGRIEIE